MQQSLEPGSPRRVTAAPSVTRRCDERGRRFSKHSNRPVGVFAAFPKAGSEAAASARQSVALNSQPRMRFCIEVGRTGLSGSLLLVTLLWRDWIALVSGIDPDHYSGFYEWILGVLFR